MNGPTAGQDLDGYLLERRIGQGAMGEVFLARDQLLERPVAIKFIAAGQADEMARERFMVEARAIARLQHPNVVTIYRVGEHQGRPYLVSEFVPGTALDRLAMPLDQGRLMEIALGLSRGLAMAHRAGVVHRDIKPANAILSEDGVVKLLDFGIAKLLPGRDVNTAAAAAGGPPAEESLAATVVPGGCDALAATALPDGQEPAAFAATALAGQEAGPLDATTLPAQASLDATTLPALEGTSATVQFRGAGQRRPARTRPLKKVVDAGEEAAATAREKPRGGLTHAGAILGTPIFMSPEVWQGEVATFASDIYSLGALLYQLATGRPPLDAETLVELRDQVTRDGEVEPLEGLAPGISPGLAAVIHRCLERDPARRPATGNDLRAALVQLTPAGRGAGDLPGGNPYRGLHAFSSRHRGLFFGRDSEIQLVLDRLGSEAFVLVAGDSGVGKSSLCRAGILPRVGQWRTGRRWQVVRLVPGRHPVSSLCVALAPLLGQPEQELVQEMMSDPGGTWRKIRASQGQDKGVVIYLDQLEELITLSDPEERQAAAELLGWLAEPCPGVRVLASARGDFLSRLSTLPRLGAAIPRALFFLWPLSRERMREAIEGPARAVNITFEPPELVDELVADTERAEGGLPLLQFTLAELWGQRVGEAAVITRDDLDRLGGVSGALARHGDEVMAQMTAEQRRAVRHLLPRMVSADGTRTRRLAEELGAGEEPARSALDRLVQGRLVVARDSQEGPTYEIAHEALVEHWGTLARWLSHDADARRLRERLDRAVKEWQRLDRGEEALWGPRQVREVKALEVGELSGGQVAFLAACRRAHRRGRLRRVVLLASVPLLVALVYLGLTVRARVVLGQRVEQRVSLGVSAMERARSLARQAERARTGALARFDRWDQPGGEAAWKRYLGALSLVGPALEAASQELETALLLDQEWPGTHALMADLLLEQALQAERRGAHEEAAGLLKRLSLYDHDGARRARWNAPGQVTVVPSPRGTMVLLSRQTRREDGAMVARGSRLLVAGEPVSLAPGSCQLMLSAPGRATARAPFLLRRGEALKLEIPLPMAARVPEGFAYIPPGRFLFGSGAEEGLRRDFFHHVPLHQVRTGAYLIARHEVTFARWLAYVEDAPAHEQAARLPGVKRGGFQGTLALKRQEDGVWGIRFQPTTQAHQARAGEKLHYPGRGVRAKQDWLRLPVVGVSAGEAKLYAAWLSSSGKVPGARLCSELEWERAYRGADDREFPHGHSLGPLQANIDATYGKDPPAMGPDEVGSFPASRGPFGLDDMAGNVWEWTTSSLKHKEVVARGGSWYFGANSARATDREITEPTFKDVSVGLRICADVK